MKEINYLEGCIREIGYFINEELDKPVARYGQESLDHRIAGWRTKIETLRAQIAQVNS